MELLIYKGVNSINYLIRSLTKNAILLIAVVVVLSIVSNSCSWTSNSPSQALPNLLVQNEESLGSNLITISGQLVIKDDYLRLDTGPDINTGTSAKSYLVIWPQNYSLARFADKVQVLDEKGQPQAWVGDQVCLAGKEITEERAKTLLQKPVLDNMAGPYYLADSTRGIPYLPVQMDGLQLPPGPYSSLEGHLMMDNNYTYLKTSSEKSYLLIWPAGHRISIYGNTWFIYDVQGQPIASAGNQRSSGDAVRVNGFELSSDTVGQYVGVAHLPQTWNGPFWLVSSIEINSGE